MINGDRQDRCSDGDFPDRACTHQSIVRRVRDRGAGRRAQQVILIDVPDPGMGFDQKFHSIVMTASSPGASRWINSERPDWTSWIEIVVMVPVLMFGSLDASAARAVSPRTTSSITSAAQSHILTRREPSSPCRTTA